MATTAVIVIAAAVGITLMLTSGSDGDTPPTSFPQTADDLESGDPQPPVDGRLELGPAESLGEYTVGPGGGDVSTSDGLRISVPAGAHDLDVPYRIERKPVTRSTFPDWIQPVSPLYVVDNGGTISLRPITIEVPATIPRDGFAMGLFYDETTGQTEAMPLVDVTETSVTVATAHFSSFVVVLLPGWGPGNPAISTVDTGFRPGVDDWQFTNYGSFIAPGGHCAGQSMSAMWYYIEKRLNGSPSLFGTYDNNGAAATPGLWEDDSDGYRLASSIQLDLDTGWPHPEFEAYSQHVGSDALQYTAFMAAMSITGHPQFVGIWSTDPSVPSGHAMIVYGADPTGLQVADPNYPGQLRTIPWDASSQRLGPYQSAANAGGPGYTFDLIGYFGLDALVNWGAITDRWTTFEAQRAGDGVFPDFTLLSFDATAAVWSPLGPTAMPATERFTVTAEMLGIPWRLTVYGPSGSVAGQQEQPVSSDLPTGTHDIGILVEAMPPGINSWTYVDYVDVVVTIGGVPPTAQQPPVTGGQDLDPQMLVFVGPVFGYSEVEVGSTMALIVSVWNEGPGGISNVEVTSSVPDCNRSFANFPVHDGTEYICYVDVDTLGTQDHWVAATAVTETGGSLSNDDHQSIVGVEPDPYATYRMVSIEIDPPIPRVAVGQAATFQATLTNTFPADWGTSDPLVLEVFTSHHPWVGDPLYTQYPDPEGAPAGFAVTCTGATLQGGGPSGTYLLELNGGTSATLTCTVPGVSVAGIGYYMFWAITYSGYDVGNAHTRWMVEVLE